LFYNFQGDEEQKTQHTDYPFIHTYIPLHCLLYLSTILEACLACLHVFSELLAMLFFSSQQREREERSAKSDRERWRERKRVFVRVWDTMGLFLVASVASRLYLSREEVDFFFSL
jgi:hypothetical protein